MVASTPAQCKTAKIHRNEHSPGNKWILGSLTYIYRSLGQGNIFIGMCQEFCSQWGCLLQCMLGYTPLEQTPPPSGTDTSWADTPPPSRADPQKQTPPEQTPPSTGRECWEIWSMCGWYASYWNAILLCNCLQGTHKNIHYMLMFILNNSKIFRRYNSIFLIFLPTGYVLYNVYRN